MTNHKDIFCHLHCHSMYSFLDGYGTPQQFVDRAKLLGQRALAITDHGNVSAHKRWWDACTEAGIKPILGVEAYVVDELAQKPRGQNHITLLAKTLEGYRNLLRVVSHSWEHGFYYKPRTDWEILRQHRKGLIATSSCPSGKLGRGIIREGWSAKRVSEEFQRQSEIFDDYYAEVSPWQYPDGVKMAQAVYDTAKVDGVPLVMTMDAHYPSPEDAHIQDIMLCINQNEKFSNPNRMKFSQQDFCLHSGADMAAKWEAIHGERLPVLDEMIFNTKKIADSIDFKFPTTKPLEFPYAGDKTQMLSELCERGLKFRKLKGKEVRDRLKYEFDLVVSKNFVDYFLIVADMIVWAKNQGILVGPARGSSCGSLMCFLLRITDINPLLHGLLVERFIDVTRTDLPDIDVDFDAERRHEVKEYVTQKYGHDKVANLATFGTFKGKLCLQDIGRVFSDRIPQEAVEETKRLIIQRSSADSRAGFAIEDTFANFDQAAAWLKKYPELGLAKHLEGQIRQLGVHAAGVVISNDPITDFAATYVTKNKDRVISMDYHDASSVGLLKIDMLGLTALTVQKKILELVKSRHGKAIDLEAIPLEDPEVYKSFCRQNLQGIFQFEGGSTRQVCRQVAPDNFKELVAVNALSRPGPLHSGGTTSYIERRWGKEPIEKVHPILDEITKDTYGITVYQEQVMRTVRDMGKFSWAETATVRKAMSKKFGDEFFSKMQEKFVAGGVSQGVPGDVASKVWKNICTFGSWAFNLCVSGDTLIRNASPNKFAKDFLTVKELFNNEGYATDRWREQPKAYKKMRTLGMDVDGRIRPARIKAVFNKGVAFVLQIVTSGGKAIKVTQHHKLLGRRGFVKAEDFKIGQEIGVNGGFEPEERPRTKFGKGWRKGRTGGAGDFIDYRTVEVDEFKAANLGRPCEHCGGFHRRMEVHHVTHEAPNSILEWLCPGCHKKAEYKRGRVRVWQKGFSVKFERVVSINLVGTETVYDIEMEDASRPTFVANEFISHNSHSVAYSVMAYQLMWLKVYYPAEFYTAAIGCEQDAEKKRRMIKEYTLGGGKLLPVCINASQNDLTCDQDAMRLGLSAVVGIGEMGRRKILAAQPFKSFVDFEKRSKLPPSQRQKLLKIGAFRNLEFDSLQEQQDLFGGHLSQRDGFDYKQPKEADVMEFCPLAAESKTFEKWRVWVKKKTRSRLWEIREIDDITDRTELLLIGTSNPKHFNAKNKVEESASRGNVFVPKEGEEDFSKEQYNFLNFDFEDETDVIIVRLSYKMYPAYKSWIWSIKPSDVLGVRGMCNGTMRMVFATCVVNLSDMGRRIRAKEPLTKDEQTFFQEPKPRKRKFS